MRDDDEESQLGGSADDHREPEVPMGLWRERDRRDEGRGRQRGTREDVTEMTAGHKERERGRQGEVRRWSQEDRLQDSHYKKKVMNERGMRM